MSLGRPTPNANTVPHSTNLDLPPAFYGAVTFLLLVVAFCGLFFFEGSGRWDTAEPAALKNTPASSGAETGEPVKSESTPAVATPPEKKRQADLPKHIEQTSPVRVARPPMKPDWPIDGIPRLAIVIDDWGYPSSEAAAFLKMGIPMTAAIIPHLPASEKYAKAAADAGYDVLVHLPMEPEDSKLRSAGMITTDMSDTDIATTVKAALDSLPMVVGINNHMGSKATADSRVMRAVLEVVRQKDLIYLDSRTSSYSLGAATAVEMGLPLLENTTFIDGEANKAYIRKQLLQAARLAKQRGVAIAIGHVRPVTADAVESVLAEIEAMGVRLARLTELVGLAPQKEQQPSVIAADNM